MSEQTKKIPTQGSFKVTSVTTNEVVHEGFSKQIEICYRDYLSWALKGTAPKRIQAVVDASEKTALPMDLFTLTMVAMDDATFAAATHKATTTAAPKQPKYLTLLDQLQAEIKKDVSILPALRLAVAKLFAPEEIVEPTETTETDLTTETDDEYLSRLAAEADSPANEIDTDDETDTLTEMAVEPEPNTEVTDFGKEVAAALENDSKANRSKHGKNRK